MLEIKDSLSIPNIGTVVIKRRLGRGEYWDVYRVETETETGTVTSAALKIAINNPEKPLSIRENGRVLWDGVASEVAASKKLGMFCVNSSMVIDGKSRDVMLQRFLGEKPLSREVTRKMTPLEQCEIARQMVGALCILHRLGIVHRDVKPGNFIWDDLGECLSLGDLGFALLPKDGQVPMRHTTGLAMCTPDYAAPESLPEQESGPGFQASTADLMSYQRTEAEFSDSTDRYSLGVSFAVLFNNNPILVAYGRCLKDRRIGLEMLDAALCWEIHELTPADETAATVKQLLHEHKQLFGIERFPHTAGAIATLLLFDLTTRGWGKEIVVLANKEELVRAKPPTCGADRERSLYNPKIQQALIAAARYLRETAPCKKEHKHGRQQMIDFLVKDIPYLFSPAGISDFGTKWQTAIDKRFYDRGAFSCVRFHKAPTVTERGKMLQSVGMMSLEDAFKDFNSTIPVFFRK